MKNLDVCVRDVVERGADDWIQAAEVASVVKTLCDAETPPQIREIAEDE